MTWTQTHHRQGLLRRTEALLELQRGGPLPWSQELADTFGDRDELLAALRLRWRQRLQAQVDPELGEAAATLARDRLLIRHRGLVRLLEEPTVRSECAGAA